MKRRSGKHLGRVAVAMIASSVLVTAQDEPVQPEPPTQDPPVEDPATQDPAPPDPATQDPATQNPEATPVVAPTESEPTPPDAVAAPPVPEPPAPPSFASAFDLAAIEDSLRRIAEGYPELAKLVEIGKSRGGRSIHALVLSDSSITAANAKPGLLVVDHLNGSTSRCAEVGLALAWNLVSTHDSDPEAAEFLRRFTITVVPAADPDARVGDEAVKQRTVEFDRNFPVGWLPRSVQPGGGDYPLSEPECLSLARLLGARPETIALVTVQSRGYDRTGRREEAEEWEGRPRMHWPLHFLVDDYEKSFILDPGIMSARGSLQAYASEAQGIYPITLPPFHPDTDLAVRVTNAANEIRALGRDLPRVTVEEVGLERLGHGLWQLDLVVRNDGRLPTRSPIACHRFPASEILLDLAGGKLMAAARRDDEIAAYQVLSGRPRGVEGRVAVRDLDGGQSLGLRLIVEAESGVTLEVRGASPAAGAARLTRVLP